MIGVINYNKSNDVRFYFEERDLDEMYLWDVGGIFINYGNRMACNMVARVSNELTRECFHLNLKERPIELELRNYLYGNILRDGFDSVHQGFGKTEFIYVPDYSFDLMEKVQFDLVRKFRDELCDSMNC